MSNIPTDIQKSLLAKYGIEQEDLNITLDELDSFGDTKSIKDMMQSIAAYNSMLEQRITFINKDITRAIPFTRENLYLMCAYSGSGKSSAAANVSHPLWKQGKKTVVISNEESEQDIIFRIACLELGYDFNKYKKGLMPVELQKECIMLFPSITKCVKVVDVNYKNGITTKVEGVKSVLEAIKNEDYSCAMIDYFQLIKTSVEKPGASVYEVLNDFRIWLGRYIKRSNIPIVVFAQLHSLGKRNNKDLDSRIKDCPTIYEPSTVVIEMQPDFENKTTNFIIHKDRFGLAGHKITCGFHRGRFVTMDSEAMKNVQLDKAKELESIIDTEEHDKTKEDLGDGSS